MAEKEDYKVVRNESKLTPGLQVFKKESVLKAGEKKTIRVAAYCRVSTDKDEQKSSLETQMEAYDRVIKEHPGWELAKIYRDNGVTGTSAARRVGFMQMIKDAKDGKFDYIIAKSTSRFARNTVDALSYTRDLKELGIGVYFEEQNLDTLGITSEILLTIHAAFAQEESHSISENLKKGVRSRFAMGIPKWSLTYGLVKVDEDIWEPDEDTAPIVKRIFDYCLEGKSLPEIARILEEEKIPGPSEKNWYPHTISQILHNEKYIGDVAMQKDYTIDHITHKRISNKDATIPSYYKANHHPAIVDKETFELVQLSLDLKDKHKGAIQYPFYGFLRCPYCGEKMVSVTLPSRNHEQAWTCGGASSTETYRYMRTDCPEFFVKSKYIHKAVWAALDSIPDVVLRKAGADTARKYRMKDRKTDMVELVFLRDLVDTITFNKKGNGDIDWRELVVNWKFGISSTARIDYEKPSEIPVTFRTAVYKNDEYYANGELTNGQRSSYESVLALLNFCRYIQIIEQETDQKVRRIPGIVYSFIPNIIAPTSIQTVSA